jgi:SAM-dependent methyltransferase
MVLEGLKRLAASVGEPRGWDFSRMRTDRDPIPWNYADIVRRYLQPSSRVLDVGTGSGEVFLSLAPYFGTGVGIDIDPNMIQVAQENTSPSLTDKVMFKVMPAEALQFPSGVFDIVLNRHCPVFADQIARVLCSDGVFITQQVGRRNTHNILAAFGWGPESYGEDWWQELPALVEQFH